MGPLLFALLVQCASCFLPDLGEYEMRMIKYDLGLHDCIAEKNFNITTEEEELRKALRVAGRAMTWLLDSDWNKADIEAMLGIVEQELFLTLQAKSNQTLQNKRLLRAVNKYRDAQLQSLICVRGAYSSQLHSLITRITTKDMRRYVRTNIARILRSTKVAVNRTLESLNECKSYTTKVLSSVDEVKKAIEADCYYLNTAEKSRMTVRSKTTSEKPSGPKRNGGCRWLTVPQSARRTWKDVFHFLQRSEVQVASYGRLIEETLMKLSQEGNCAKQFMRIYVQIAEAVSMSLESLNHLVVGVSSRIVLESTANLHGKKLESKNTDSLKSQTAVLMEKYDYFTSLASKTLRNLRSEILDFLKLSRKWMIINNR